MKIKIICLGLLGAVMTSSLGYAAALQDEEDYIRLRLRNDLRRADKPSAGDGRDVYAWVQGVMLDANSHYYHDIIGIEGGPTMCINWAPAPAHPAVFISTATIALAMPWGR
nr:hypothetical protein [Edwardsiella piscicida]